ncbi:MAG: DUF1232 domain-containing protein [Eggerthellaceae bacterium]|nr:DUF1232 domain-containing protein [Eggerthellaceae bacterium]
MSEQFSAEWAKGIIDDNVQKAQSFMDNPEQIEDLLGQLQEKLDSLPNAATNAFKNVPVMAQMVKSYVTREYTAVSPKVVASLVAAFVYFVKKNDIIPDSVPLFGYADDLAVAAVAMVISEPELKAFAEWQAQNAAGLSKEMTPEPVEAVEAEAADVE